MDNERHAIETAPSGYFLANNGEAIKKSCETCTFYYHYQEYSIHEIGCEFNDGENGMQFLATFPFKNGCKHFDPHYIYLVDWEVEAQKMEAESGVCKHLSYGKCFAWTGCESMVPEEGDYPKCSKAPETA